MIPVTVQADIVDLVGAVTTQIVAVSCNEPAAGDWQITGPMTLLLRATRLGSGNGRVYTNTVQATDSSGNSAVRSVSVSVPHDKGHG